MLPLWTGEVVGTMHIYGITSKELAGRIGIARAYLSRLLNAKNSTATAEKQIKEALKSMVEEKVNASEADY